MARARAAAAAAAAADASYLEGDGEDEGSNSNVGGGGGGGRLRRNGGAGGANAGAPASASASHHHSDPAALLATLQPVRDLAQNFDIDIATQYVPPSHLFCFLALPPGFLGPFFAVVCGKDEFSKEIRFSFHCSRLAGLSD
jgi:hypothetical protein